MPLFPLDAVRIASPARDLELALEDLRAEVASFPFALVDGTDVQDVLEVYDLSRPRLNVLTTLLRDLQGSAGLDIGTGFGFLPVLLQRFGLSVTATALQAGIGEFATAHDIPVLSYRIGAGPAPVPHRSVDFVVLAEVLEHLKAAPVHVLRELHGLLRPGGRLVLTTPNVARLAHVEALAAGENFLEPFDEAVPLGADPTEHLEHVREYSVREVLDAVEAAGFVVDDVLMTGWGEAGYHPPASPYAADIIVVRASASQE